MSTWGEPCEVDNCLGSAVWAGHCITHLTDVESDAFIQQLAETRILVAANIEIEAGVLKKLLSFGGGLEDPPTVVGIVLEGATITGDLSATIRVLRFATFNRATFAGDVDLTFDAHCPVDFAQATFQRRTEIYGTFMHDADFAATSFAQKATIRPTIDGKGVFLNSRLEQGGDFSNARFGTFWLESCVIGGPLVLAGVSTGNRQPMADDQERRFERDSWWAPVPNGSDALVRIFRESQKELLKRHTIAPGVRIVNITFTYPLDLTYQRFAGKQCAFVNVRFDRRVTFAEGALSADHVLLRECYFTEQTAMQVAAEAFDVDSTTFLAGAELDVSAHRLKIERCRFDAPSRISAWIPEHSVDRAATVPQLLSLRRTVADGLRLSNLDLAPCRFAEVHALDRVAIEGPLLLAAPPPPRLAARRRLIADEWDWRARMQGWKSPARVLKPPAAEWDTHRSEAPESTSAAIAGLYRALRKGLEDNKDEPGAADFYYGEMEMRRQAAHGGEGVLLWLYWLVAGYGLRATRVLGTYVVTIVTFALLFWRVGFRPDQSFARAVLFSVETSSSLVRAPEVSHFSVTEGGEALQLALRLVGALLLGLFVLALRGRVKR